MKIVIRRAFGERIKKLGLRYRRLPGHYRNIFSLEYSLRPWKIQRFLCGVGTELTDYEAITSLDFARKVRLYNYYSKIWFSLLDDGRCEWHDDGALFKVQKRHESGDSFLIYIDGGRYVRKKDLDLIQQTILETYINELGQLSKIYIKEIEKIFLEKDENGKPKYYSTKHTLIPA